MKRYSDKKLREFRVIIEQKIAEAENSLKVLRSSQFNENGTDDTYVAFKAFEGGSKTMSREQNAQFRVRQENFIRDLKQALFRIENKTYGKCRVTGKLISEERLKLVPHATLSIEAKMRSAHEQRKHVSSNGTIDGSLLL